MSLLYEFLDVPRDGWNPTERRWLLVERIVQVLLLAVFFGALMYGCAGVIYVLGPVK